jgi:hypothetical protein
MIFQYIYLRKPNSEGLLWLIPSLDCAWLISKYSMLGPESMVIKDVFIIILIGVYFKWITVIEFVYVTAFISWLL